MLTYTAVLFVASMAVGQAEERGRMDDFGKLRGFRGAWEAKGIEYEGKTLSVSASWTPILDGRFIEHKWMSLDPAENVSEWGLVIFGRDPADQKVHAWGFDNKGGFMAMELTGWDGNKSNWSTVLVKADGTVQKSSANSFELSDRNSYNWVLALDDGNRAEAVFKRIAEKKDRWPERQVEMPANVSEQLKELAWWTGDYTMEGSDAFTGKTVVGQSKCGWTLDGSILLYDISSVDSDLSFTRYRAVIGVDPTTKETTGWEFESTGAVGKYTVSEKGQDIVGKATSPEAGLLDFKGRMTKSADVIEYRATGSLPNDKKTSYHGIWRLRN